MSFAKALVGRDKHPSSKMRNPKLREAKSLV